MSKTRALQSRVASKMAFVLEAQAVLPEPSDAELREFFDAHSERWAEDPRVDFTQVFINGLDDEARARADDLLKLLRRGANENGLGDTFTGGRRYRGRKPDDLARSFGSEFTEGLTEQPVGEWALRKSRFGYHVVRIDAKRAGQAADFDKARLDVRSAWRDDKKKTALEDKLKELRGHWEIVGGP